MREIEHSDRPANIIGIDLGTTEVRVTRFAENGLPERTNNAEGSSVTPSVIQIDDDGNVIVGSEAKKFLGMGIPNVFAEFRREMGNDRSWLAGETIVTPVSLTALILKKVVGDYTEQFGPPSAIAITWPSNFRNEQREATKLAARIAGIPNPIFIEEEVAAALYYALSRSLQGKYLIHDFSGSTFNVSLVEAHGNQISVLHQASVQQLGERDFHHVLLRIIGEKFQAKTGDEFDTVDCNFTRLDIESTLSTLILRPTVMIRLTSGKHGPWPIEVSRDEFEAGIAHLVTQAEMACEHVMRCGKDDPAQHTKPSEIRDVFMIGKASRVPALQASVERLFRKKPIIQEPDQAIANGAAIYAVLKSNHSLLNALQLRSLDALKVSLKAPHYFGLAFTDWLTGETYNRTIIPKGTSLPVRRTFRTQADARGHLPTIRLTQSSIEEKNVEFVTTIWSGNVAPTAPHADIELIFAYDENGTMCFSVTEVATGNTTIVDLRPVSDER